jgi:chemotaxis methyl-accepting protein methylase
MRRIESADPIVLPLAYGELSEREAAALSHLKQLITERVGFHCHEYKERCLRRRIAVRMRARGVHSYRDYATLLEEDAAEYERLLDVITINVSKFFRNAEAWDVVRREVIPELFALPDPVLRVWSAGAATGEEAYSVAMAVREYAEASGQDSGRFRILATDIDRSSLASAVAGEFGAFSFSETPPEQRDRWFENGSGRVRREVREMVTFAQHDLIREEPPDEQHLILCRNVVIYFERAAHQRLFRRFADALRPGGFLVLGKVESLFGPVAAMFRPVAGRQRVFRRK